MPTPAIAPNPALVYWDDFSDRVVGENINTEGYSSSLRNWVATTQTGHISDSPFARLGFGTSFSVLESLRIPVIANPTDIVEMFATVRRSRLSNNETPGTGISLAPNGQSTSTESDITPFLRVGRQQNTDGVYGQRLGLIGNFTTGSAPTRFVNFDPDSNQWFNMRLRREGNDLWGKAWLFGDSEPEWMVFGRLATSAQPPNPPPVQPKVTEGNISIIGRPSNNSSFDRVDVDFYSVAFGGARAPSAPVPFPETQRVWTNNFSGYKDIPGNINGSLPRQGAGSIYKSWRTIGQRSTGGTSGEEWRVLDAENSLPVPPPGGNLVAVTNFDPLRDDPKGAFYTQIPNYQDIPIGSVVEVVGVVAPLETGTEGFGERIGVGAFMSSSQSGRSTDFASLNGIFLFLFEDDKIRIYNEAFSQQIVGTVTVGNHIQKWSYLKLQVELSSTPVIRGKWWELGTNEPSSWDISEPMSITAAQFKRRYGRHFGLYGKMPKPHAVSYFAVGIDEPAPIDPPNQFVVPISDFAMDSGRPPGFHMPWRDTVQYSVEPVTSPLGGTKAIRVENGAANERRALAWEGSAGRYTSSQVLMLVKDRNAAFQSGVLFGPMSHIDDIATSENGNGAILQGGPTRLRSQTYRNGTGATQTQTAVSSWGSDWVWVKLETYDTNRTRGKIWKFEDDEPSVPQFDIVQPSILDTGWAGIFSFLGEAEFDIAFMSAGFNGEPAPMPLSVSLSAEAGTSRIVALDADLTIELVLSVSAGSSEAEALVPTLVIDRVLFAPVASSSSAALAPSVDTFQVTNIDAPVSTSSTVALSPEIDTTVGVFIDAPTGESDAEALAPTFATFPTPDGYINEPANGYFLNPGKTWIDNFNDYSTGSIKSKRYVELWNTAATYDIVDAPSPSGGKILEYRSTVSARKALFNYTIPNLANQESNPTGQPYTIETFLRFRFPDNIVTGTAGIFINGTGSAGNETGVVAYFRSVNNGRPTIGRYLNGAFTVINSPIEFADYGATYSGEWINLRFRRSEDDFTATFWKEGQSEGEGFTLSGTNSDVSRGIGGVGIFGLNDGEADIDFFSVALDGAPAPIYPNIIDPQDRKDFFTDFGSYSDGSLERQSASVGSYPQAWYQPWRASAPTAYEVSKDRTPVTGNNVITINQDGAVRRAIFFNDVPTTYDYDEPTEVFGRFQRDGTTGFLIGQSVGMFLGGKRVDSNSETGLFLGIKGPGNLLRLTEYRNTAITILLDDIAVPGANQITTEWLNIRLRYVPQDGKVYIKGWWNNVEEPSAWLEELVWDNRQFLGKNFGIVTITGLEWYSDFFSAHIGDGSAVKEAPDTTVMDFSRVPRYKGDFAPPFTRKVWRDNFELEVTPPQDIAVPGNVLQTFAPSLNQRRFIPVAHARSGYTELKGLVLMRNRSDTIDFVNRIGIGGWAFGTATDETGLFSAASTTSGNATLRWQSYDGGTVPFGAEIPAPGIEDEWVFLKFWINDNDEWYIKWWNFGDAEPSSWAGVETVPAGAFEPRAVGILLVANSQNNDVRWLSFGFDGVEPPGPIKDAVINVPLVESDGKAEVPVVGIGVDLAVPTSGSDAEALAPDVELSVNVVAAVGTSTAEAIPPELVNDAVIFVVVKSSTAFAQVPTVITSTILDVPTATSTALALPPFIDIGVIIGAPVSDSSAVALAPTLSVTVNLVAPTSDSSAEAKIPAVSVGVTVSSGAGQSDAAAVAPEISTSVTVTAEVANSDADALVPDVSVSAGVEAPTATSSAEALAPSLSTSVTISAEVGTSNADALAPSLVVGITIAAPKASSQAEAIPPELINDAIIFVVSKKSRAFALAPTLSVEIQLSAPVSDSQAAAVAPAINAGAVVDAETATSTAAALSPTFIIEINVLPEPAASSAQAETPVLTVEIVLFAPKSGSRARARIPLILAGSGIVSPPGQSFARALIPVITGTTIIFPDTVDSRARAIPPFFVGQIKLVGDITLTIGGGQINLTIDPETITLYVSGNEITLQTWN